MDDLAIEVIGVGKRYRLGEHHGRSSDLRETIAALGRRVRRRPRQMPSEIWSLRDVSFSVQRGEALGIIGRNGAGKSTLLKIIGDITTPTTGRSRTRGRIGSLLEVGTGFHGELTGLENTFLNGAILGMTRKEVASRLEEIVEFAGLGAFMDTPVKRYSSGMYLRLGFSIAAHMSADILLVDEVLAVGDADFQRRCLGKMSEVENSGRTVVFVSHNMDAMARLCPRTIWLDGGTVHHDGATDLVVREYLRSGAVEGAAASFAEDRSARAQIIGATLTSDGRPTAVVTTADPLQLHIDVRVNEPTPGLDLACVVAASNGAVLLEEHMGDRTPPTLHEVGRHRVSVVIPPVLPPGRYVTGLMLGTHYELIDARENVMAFSVEGDDLGRARLVKLGLDWTSQHVPDGR